MARLSQKYAICALYLSLAGLSPSILCKAADKPQVVKDPPSGVVPNCDEKPLRFEQLVGIAQSSDVTNTIDFIHKIPQGTLQTVTFMMSSQSSQGADVTETWPRVIRTSTDGRLTIAYTCNPDEENYNQIEVNFFNDATKSWEFAHIDLRKKSTEEKKTAKIQMNPTSCLLCHDGTDGKKQKAISPRFNWEDYTHGTGTLFEGGNRHYENSEAVYKKFLEAQKDNPCYDIPRPTNSEKYPTWPFPDKDDFLNLYARNNHRIQLAQGKLLTQNIAHRISANKKYGNVQVLTLLAGMQGCRKLDNPVNSNDAYAEFSDAAPEADGKTSVSWQELDDQIEANLPGYKEELNRLSNYTFRALDPKKSYGQSLARVHAIGNLLSIRDRDWTLSFDRPQEGYYTGSTALERVVAGTLIEQYVDQNPALKSIRDSLNSKYTSKTFGEKFSCLDESRPPPPGKNRDLLCQSLMKQYQTLKKEVLSGEKKDSTDYAKCCDTEQGSIEKDPSVTNIKPSSIIYGKAVFEGKCLNCHDGKTAKNFASDQILEDYLSKHSMKSVIERLDSDDPNHRMPRSETLSLDERSNLEKYLRSIKQTKH